MSGKNLFSIVMEHCFKKTVVIVEDSYDDRLVLKKHFSRCKRLSGVRIIILTSSEKALAYIDEVKMKDEPVPDVMVLDRNLQGERHLSRHLFVHKAPRGVFPIFSHKPN